MAHYSGPTGAERLSCVDLLGATAQVHMT